MKLTKISVEENKQNFSLSGFPFAGILAPSVLKGEIKQTHYMIPSTDSSLIALQMDLTAAAENCKADFEKSRSSISVAGDAFPYKMTESQWWQYCLAPHSYLSLGNNHYQIGLNLFNRFLHLNCQDLTASLVDPEIGEECLSTTNWFDPVNEEIWFASWPLESTFRRILNPGEEVSVKIWKLSLRTEQAQKIWQGHLGDALHQIVLSADRRFVVLTELGLRCGNPVSSQSSEKASTAKEPKSDQAGLIPSRTLFLDRKEGKEWIFSIPTAGHVEFDPEKADICYLSGHNIGLLGMKVGIFGRGVIQKIRFRESGPEILGEFTHEHFYRITTHIVFRHRGKTLIAVSGYPGTLFLIDAAAMKLFKMIPLETVDKVDISPAPHLCQQDSYGIGSSKDGEYIAIVGTGFIKVADIHRGVFVENRVLDDYTPNSCFTGHIGNFLSAQG